MPNVITMQNKYGIDFPYQEGHLLKIWESPEEPNKRYLWKTPGGYTFVYCNGDWKLLELYLRDCGCVAPKDRLWITKENLKLLQEEILKGIQEYQTVNTTNLRDLVLELLSSEGYQPVDEEFRQWVIDLLDDLETRLTAEENKPDKDTVFNPSELYSMIQTAITEHQVFITAEDA